MAKKTIKNIRIKNKSKKGGVPLALSGTAAKMAAKNPGMAKSKSKGMDPAAMMKQAQGMASAKGMDPAAMMKQAQGGPAPGQDPGQDPAPGPAPVPAPVPAQSQTEEKIPEKKTPFYLYSAILCLSLAYLATPKNQRGGGPIKV